MSSTTLLIMFLNLLRQMNVIRKESEQLKPQQCTDVVNILFFFSQMLVLVANFYTPLNLCSYVSCMEEPVMLFVFWFTGFNKISKQCLIIHFTRHVSWYLLLVHEKNSNFQCSDKWDHNQSNSSKNCFSFLLYLCSCLIKIYLLIIFHFLKQ